MTNLYRMATAEEFYGCLLSAVRAASSLWACDSDMTGEVVPVLEVPRH
jgi:hypothetical protein